MHSATSIVWTCPRCGHQERTGADELVLRLQSLGMLRRGDKKALPRHELAIALELAQAASSQFKCPECNKFGLLPEAQEPLEDEWGASKPCASCGKPIPPERLELFPETDLCTACQQTLDQGGKLSGDDYCPRCGTPMTTRLSGRAGVARYEQTCPACRR